MAEIDVPAFQKVTAFVIRPTSTGYELLTFVHPLAGRQIPAGSVEEAELPASAASREVFEETGLEVRNAPLFLGLESEQLHNSGVMLETCRPLSVDNSSDSDRHQNSIRRGYRVSFEEEIGECVTVEHRVYDYNRSPPELLTATRGLVPIKKVARKLERHFFLMNCDVDGRRTWSREADGHVFKVEWVPLEPRPNLIGDQLGWLERYEHDIVRRLAEQRASPSDGGAC